MIRRITVELAFPGESVWTDVSNLVRYPSWNIDEAAFSSEKRSAVDKFSCNLKYDATILGKLRAADARIWIRVKNALDASALFFGVIEPSVSNETSDHVGEISLEAVDNSWRLDEKVAITRQLPALVADPGFKIWDALDQTHSIAHIVLIDAGYSSSEIAPISLTTVIQSFSAIKDNSTYRDLLDVLFMEYGYVIHPDASGVLTLLPWKPTNTAIELGPDDLSTVVPFRFDNRADYRDSAKVTWSELEILDDVLVYRESLPVDSDGNFTGEAIAAGDYYPKDSDIEDIYQTYVEKWLDKPYLARETRLANKDLTLVATSGAAVSFEADAGIGLNLNIFESSRAHIRFLNSAAAAASIRIFEIYADALIRKKVGTEKALPLGTEKTPREYTSQYIFDKVAGQNLAIALAEDVYAEEQYSFACNQTLLLGAKVKLIESRNGTSVYAVITRRKRSASKAYIEYEAIQLIDIESISTSSELSSMATVWPPYPTEVKLELIDDEIVHVKEDLQAVRNGDLIDGAIDRAKLEAGFNEEYESILDTIYPYGITKPSLPAIQGQALLSVEALSAALDEAFRNTEAGLIITDQRILLATKRITDSETAIAAIDIAVDAIISTVASYSDHGTRISTIEQTVEAINSILADLTVGGEIVDISLISQSATRIAQIVADGGYYDEENVFHPTAAYTEVQQLADRYQLFLQGDPSEATLAAWIITADDIASFITAQEVDDLLEPVTSQLSVIDQKAAEITLQVSTFESGLDYSKYETREDYLAALQELEQISTAGIIIANGKIDLSVQKQEAENVSIWARIVVEAGRITSEVGRAQDAEITAASRITQTEEDITAEVARAGDAEEELQASITLTAEALSLEVTRATNKEGLIDAQIVTHANSIAQRVAAKKYNPDTGEYEAVTEAFMMLSVSLPEVLSPDRRDAIYALLTTEEKTIFDRVYESYQTTWGDARYRIAPAALEADLTALNAAFEGHGILSSQFKLDADEVLISHTIRGEHLEMDSISTEIFEAIQARIEELSAKKVFVDTDPESNTDFEVYIDKAHGILCRIDGADVFSVDPITKRAKIRGEVYASAGSFEGSIHAGPMDFNMAPPATTTKTISGYIADFILALESSTGLTGGRFACSGSYGSETLGAIEFSISRSTQTYSYYQKTGTVDHGYYQPVYGGTIWVPIIYNVNKVWARSVVRSSCTIKLYNEAGNVVLESAEWYEPASTWVDSGTTIESLDTYSTSAPTNPVAAARQGVSFASSGSVSLSASARTFKFIGLPSGYDASYATGIVYVDSNGFLKIKV